MAAGAPPPSGYGSRFARGWAPALLCAIAILLAYSRVRDAGFIWDDDAHITANPTVVGPQGLKEIWSSAKANYSPLTMTSFWVLHALAGLSPAPYHVVTVLFHVAAALMLWLVLRELRVPGSWLGAMLWALHPVQVESVAWISELKNTQSGFFFLVAVWFFIRWLHADTVPRFRRDYVLALIAALLAILSKSSTVMLPVIMGLVAWWTGKRRWQDTVWLAPFFVISLAASGWTIWEQKVNSMASGPEWSHGLAARFVIAGKVVWFYLGKLIWPDPLVFIYPRWNPGDVGWLAWLPLGAAVVVAGIAWQQRHGAGRPLSLAFGYFVVSLFPVLGFFDVFFFRYSFVGDHLQYLASMGPLVLLGAGLAVVAKWMTRGTTLSLVAVGVCVLSGLGLRTASQARIYQSDFTLWEATVKGNPDAWIARVNFGQQLEARGRPAEALAHYDVAVRMKRQFTEVEVNYGNALLRLGRPAEAIPHFERAIHGGRGLIEAHNGMGLALVAVGRLPEAVGHYEAALKLQPEHFGTLFNVGAAYFTLGRHADALTAWQGVIKIAPGFVRAHENLGAVLLELGQYQVAISALETALRLDPSRVEARCNLALAFVAVGRGAEATQQIDLALQLRPDFQAAREIRKQAEAAVAAAREVR